MQVTDGSWVMRQAVGSTPFIIGTKLNTTYHRGARYLETTIDIQSNATAARVTSYVCGSLTSMCISLGFLLEGKVPEHLPEQLLGTVCLERLDLTKATPIDTAKPLQAPGTNAASTAENGSSAMHAGSAEGSAATGAAGGGSGHRRTLSVADGCTPLETVLRDASATGSTATPRESRGDSEVAQLGAARG